VSSNESPGCAGICMDAMARLPWGLWVGLAVLSHIALHALALRPYAIMVDPGTVGAALAYFLVGGLVASLQYLVPALCLSALLARLAQGPGAIRPDRKVSYPADTGEGLRAWQFEQPTAAGLHSPRSAGEPFVTIA
jgi:hypothetical protein